MEKQEVVSSVYRENYYLKAFDGSLEKYLDSLRNKMDDNRFKEAFHLAGLKAGERILDVGCGRGELVYFSLLRGAGSAVGIDYSRDALSIAESAIEILSQDLKSRASFLCQNISVLKLEGEFDCCFLTDIVEHLTEQQLYKLFSEVKRHLSKEGRIIIHTAPNVNWIRFEYPLKRFLGIPFTLVKRLGGKKSYVVPSGAGFFKKLLSYLDLYYIRDYYSYSPNMHINEQSPGSLKKMLGDLGFDFRVWCEDGSSNIISIICKKFWGPDIWAVARNKMGKIVFLDRDGVINKGPQGEYVTSKEELEFLPGAIEAIRKLSKAGYKIFVVSNQQGVGKGIFNQESLDEITKRMLEIMKQKGARMDGVYYCTHTEDGNCLCRKPKTGLINAAINGLNVDLKETFFIGDTEGDVKTGRAAGCKTILTLSGKTKTSGVLERWDVKPDYVFDDLKDAVRFILRK